MKPIYFIIFILLATSSLGQDLGTYENPIPIGKGAYLDDGWEITVWKAFGNGERITPSDNATGDRKPFFALIGARYDGPGTSQFDWSRMHLKCGSNEYNMDSKIHENEYRSSSGGEITGEISWLIEPSDLGNLRMYDSRCLNDNDRIYFALYFFHRDNTDLPQPPNETAAA